MQAHDLLVFAGERVGPGLTTGEVDRVQTRFGFRFALVHRAFLSIGLPRGPQWPDWRGGSVRDLRGRVQAPTDGVVADVLEHDFWPARWGPRPSSLREREAVGRRELARVPALVPLFARCYVPGGDGRPQVPVLTVDRTQVDVVGHDLAHYVGRVLAGHDPVQSRRPLRVPFWSDLAELFDPGSGRTGLLDPAPTPRTR